MSGRKRLSALRRRASVVKTETAKTHEEVTEKRAAKRKPKLAEVVKLAVKVKQINSTNVEQWFRDGVWALYGKKFIIPSWTVKQRTLAKRLLTAYGPELTKDAVDLLCSGWRSMVSKSRGRLSGAPTVNLLWGMRERVYADVQNKGKEEGRPENSDEYHEDDGGNDVGW